MNKLIPLLILSTSGMAVLNELFAGERFPGINNVPLTGSDVVTGVLAILGLCVSIYGILKAFLSTLSHFRVSNEKSLDADYGGVDFTGDKEASWLYLFPNLQFLIALLLFIIPVWGFSIFGIITGFIYKDMILLVINKI